jgi:hypothetical protein
MSSVTIREYNPSTGALLGTVSTLSFGKISSGAHSRVRVFDIAFGDLSEGSEITNLKIGLISNANIVVNTNPGTIYDDQSSQNGHFGIMSSLDFDASIASSPLERHFVGLNSSGLATDENNVLIEMKSSNVVSYFIYLDVEVASEATTIGNGAYKLFYDIA